MENPRSHRTALVHGRGTSALPVEFLTHVFAFASYEDHATLSAISHTNRDWRRIATSTPSLWVYIDFDGSTNYSLDILKMYLDRSKRAMLSIQYYPSTIEVYRASFPILLEHVDRWRQFRSETNYVEELVKDIVERLPDPPTLPNLWALLLTGHRNSKTLPFPPIRLPVIRRLALGYPYSSVSSCSVPPGLTSINMLPTSLSDFVSSTTLYEITWTISKHLVVQDGLRLDLPRLEKLTLAFSQMKWAVISKVFGAMAHCRPFSLKIIFLAIQRYRQPLNPALNPSARLLSRVENLNIEATPPQSLDALSLSNVGQILARTPMLENLVFSRISNARTLLSRITVDNVPLPDLSRLEVVGADKLDVQLVAFLIRRKEQGIKTLEYLKLSGCGRRSEKLEEIKELVQALEWNDRGVPNPYLILGVTRVRPLSRSVPT